MLEVKLDGTITRHGTGEDRTGPDRGNLGYYIISYHLISHRAPERMDTY